MLPSFIIDQIRQREEEKRQSPALPVQELPLPAQPEFPPAGPAAQPEEEESERGVVIIDL